MGVSKSHLTPQTYYKFTGKGICVIIGLMKIITTPDLRLREKSEKVREIDEDVLNLISDMRRLSLEWEKAHPYELSAAMAAPQLGVNKRVIIIRDDTEDKNRATFTALINPEVIKTEGKIIKDYEGCLSVPNIYGMVPRPFKARVKAKLEDGTEVRIKATGDLARTLLHEIDHLNGILFIDHIKDDTDAFYKMSESGDLVPLDYETNIRNNKELWGDED
jgi:peptide deformylase